MFNSYDCMNKYVGNKKTITVQLSQNDRVVLHDDYMKSIQNTMVRHAVDKSAEYIISINEGYESVFVTTYISNEEKWHKMKTKDGGQGQYIVDFIQTDDDNLIVTYRIETKDKKGVLEDFYFSYRNK